MPVGKISFNVHAQGVKDPSTLKSLLREIDPVAVLVMDGLGLLLELKTILPDMIAIDREYPDVNPLTETSAHWLNRKSMRIGSSDVWCYTTNEPIFTKEVIAWHVQLIKENAKRQHPLKIVGVNLGAGHPASWDDAKELLQLADQYRSWFILGLHEYAAVVPTSGFIGGDPVSQHLALSAQWPRGNKLELMKPPLSGMSHCGRVFYLNDFCNTQSPKIKPPRVILTEHGFDHLNDLDFWYPSLQLTSPYPSISGWKSLVNAWRNLFPQWSEGRTLYETIQYLDSELYRGTNVEAQLLYCWGWVDRQWETFDVSTNTVFHSFLKDYVRGLLMATPASPSVPRPTPAGEGYKGTINTASNIRIGTGTTYTVLGKTTIGEEVLYYPEYMKWDTMNKYQWIWVEPTDLRKSAGWVALVSPVSELFTATQPPLPPPPEENSVTPPPFPPAIDMASLTAGEKFIAAEYLSWIGDVATYLESQLRKGN